MVKKKHKTVLVAGGAGFVGSHLCDFLLSQGCRVICLDNLSTGSKENIRHLLSKKDFVFIEGDVERKCNFRVEEIYHLASPASPPFYQKMPLSTFKANVLGSLNLLEMARKNKAKILLASTSEVYGDPSVHPQTEKYWGNVNPIGIRSCYDESKRAAESLFMDYHRQYKTKVKIVRIFNTYGPRMDANDGRVVSNFITQALRDKPLTIYGDGSQTRSLQYISDLIEGLVKMMGIDKFTGPVNLGNPIEMTVGDLAKKIIAWTGSKSKLVRKKLPSDDPKKRCPDISLAKKRLGWHPVIDLKHGIRLTIAYFREKGEV